MLNSTKSEEFIGRLVVSYKNEDLIYAYDEITYGLYRFSVKNKEVDLLIPPTSIYRNSFNEIKAISKYEDEIILIPSFLNSEWIFFDIKKEKIRYSFPLKNEVSISGAITIGVNLFLIPSNVNNPVIIFSLKEMKIIKFYRNWYEQSKADNGIHVWGASFYGDFVVFPVIGSKQIYCMNMKDINMIMFDIPDTILSVSICMDKIWILPTKGEYIYASDIKGNIVIKVNLFQGEMKNSVNKYNRIIATEETVFLLPLYGEDICAYQCKKGQIVKIKMEEAYLYGRLFKQEITPYWDYIIENETLHILPRDCRYKKINIFSLENKEYYLNYGKNINYEKYWQMLRDNQKDYMYEKRKRDFEIFFQYIYSYCNNPFMMEKSKRGKQIWKKLMDMTNR